MAANSKFIRALRTRLSAFPTLYFECDDEDRITAFEDAYFCARPRWYSPEVGTSLKSWLGSKWVDDQWQAVRSAARRRGLAPVRFKVSDHQFQGWVTNGRTLVAKRSVLCCLAIQRLWPFEFESDSDIDATSLEVNIPPVVWRRIGRATADLVFLLDASAEVIGQHHTRRDDAFREAVGKSVFDYIAPEFHDELKQALELASRTGVTASVQFEAADHTGRTERFEGRVCSLSQVDGESCLVLAATSSRMVNRSKHGLSREERALRQLLEIHDRERRLVANEIHDGLLQDVVGAQMMLQAAIENVSDPQQLKESLGLVRQSLDEVMREGRRLISDLRPMVIDETGLVNSIEYLRHEFAKRFPHVKLSTSIQVSFRRLEPILEGTLFRVIKEATLNAVIHGKATEVSIRMLQVGSRFLLLEIRDNGCGFELANVDPQRYGLMGMRDRAKAFHGGCSLETAPNQGTRLTFRIPLTEGDFSRELF